MKKYSIVFGLLTAVVFAGTALACDMPGMKEHSGPCKIEHKKQVSDSSKKTTQEQNKKSNEHHKHNHK